MNKTKTRLMLMLILGFSTAYAQQSANAAGGKASGSGGMLSYSVGEIVYTTISGSNGSIAQGVQQPYEISDVLSLEGGKDISLNIMAYPNPTVDKLVLRIDSFNGGKLAFQLFDLNGRLLFHDSIKNTETEVSMQNYESGVYILKIVSTGKEIRTFKIIKNKTF